MAPKWLPRVNIREMHFDKRDSDRGERVAQSNTGMRQSSRVHDDPGNSPLLGGVNTLDQSALLVALERLQCDPFFPCRGDQAPVDAVQVLSTIDCGFANSQHVQVWTVEDQDFAGCPRALAPLAPDLGHGREFAVDVRTCLGLVAFSRVKSVP